MIINHYELNIIIWNTRSLVALQIPYDIGFIDASIANCLPRCLFRVALRPFAKVVRVALSIGTDRELSCNPVAMLVRPSSGIVCFDMMAVLAGATRVGRLDDFTARLFAVLKTPVGQTVLSRRSTHTMSASFRTNRRLAIH